MLNVYIGYDPIDDDAYKVCEASLRKHASIPVRTIPVKDRDMRRSGLYWRSYWVDRDGQKWDDRDGKPFSTDFSFTRFCPLIMEKEGWHLFCDPDMLWRADVKELLDLAEQDKKIMCVKHDHRPPEDTKMVGQKQTRYARKNWSSLFLFRGHNDLTKYQLNNMSGSFLHGFMWLDDELIGDLPEGWNWLEGWSSPDIDPKVIHFTRGTPDMVGHEDAAYAEEWWESLGTAAS